MPYPIGMQAKVALLARVRQTKGYGFVPVVIKKGRPVAPDFSTTFYLRYTRTAPGARRGRRITEAVGPDLDAAFTAYQNRELNLTRSRMGLAPISGVADYAVAKPNRVLIADAVKSYIADLDAAVRQGKKSRNTIRGYRKAVEDFRDQCGVDYLDQVTARTLRDHERWMYDELPKRVHGKKSNTVAKLFRYLNTFFNKNGIQMVRAQRAKPGDAGLMDWSDLPREEKPTTVDKYSPEDLRQMLSVATVDQADLIHFFLRTGCRDEEAAYLEWADVKFKHDEIVISEKPGVWKPKDKEQRTIPVADGVLLPRLEARRKRQDPPSKLVFPNTLGSPDMHLIRQLHSICKKLDKTGYAIEGKRSLHRFRRTYASMMIATSDLQTVQGLLGHSDIATTSRYLAPDQSKAKKASATAFEGIE